MTLRPHTVRTRIAQVIAVMCAALFVTRAQTAQAGINVWTSHGPGTHVDVFALAIDPSTPSTLYAGGVPGGAFKSTDGGRSWQAIGSWQVVLADMRGRPGVYALAIDPTTPATLYAGTVVSERNEGFAGVVFKTTDAGSTWQAANDDVTYASVARTVAIDPSTPGTLYAGYLGGGVSKSTDSGDSWQPVNAGLGNTDGIFALAIDPSSPTTIYAATHGGLFKSTDGGGGWHHVNTGLPGTDVGALAIDPATPSTLYAAPFDSYDPSGLGTGFGVFKSTDGAGSWQPVNIGLPPDTIVYALAIDPAAPRTLYAGTNGGGVFKSTDGGGTWRTVNNGLTSTHVQALAIDPDTPSTLYAATSDGGVFDLEQVPLFCVGDCGGRQTVAINDLITLVKIALGTAQSSACPNGVPSSDDVNVAVLIQAVTNALGGCMTPTPTLTPTPTATRTPTISPTPCSACTPTVTPNRTARKAA